MSPVLEVILPTVDWTGPVDKVVCNENIKCIQKYWRTLRWEDSECQSIWTDASPTEQTTMLALALLHHQSLTVQACGLLATYDTISLPLHYYARCMQLSDEKLCLARVLTTFHALTRARHSRKVTDLDERMARLTRQLQNHLEAAILHVRDTRLRTFLFTCKRLQDIRVGTTWMQHATDVQRSRAMLEEVRQLIEIQQDYDILSVMSPGVLRDLITYNQTTIELLARSYTRSAPSGGGRQLTDQDMWNQTFDFTNLQSYLDKFANAPDISDTIRMMRTLISDIPSKPILPRPPVIRR